MTKYYIGLFLIIPFILSSCSKNIENPQTIIVLILFIIMLALFATMIIIIVRRRGQSNKSLAKFSNRIQSMLQKFETTEEKIETLIILRDRIYKDERYAKDINWKKKVLAKVYLALATQYFKLNDQTQMLDACTNVIELDPDEGMTYYNRGTIYSNMGLYQKALEDLNKTIDLMPKYANAYNNRGMVLEKLGQYDAALEDYNRAIKLYKTATSYYNRGNCLADNFNDYESAINDYEICLALLNDDNSELKITVNNQIKELKDKLNKYNE